MTVGAAHARLSRDAVASSTNDVDVIHYYSRETGWPTLTQPEQDKELVLQDHTNSQHFHMQQDSDESSLLSRYSCTYGNIYIPLGKQTCTFSVLS